MEVERSARMHGVTQIILGLRGVLSITLSCLPALKLFLCPYMLEQYVHKLPSRNQEFLERPLITVPKRGKVVFRRKLCLHKDSSPNLGLAAATLIRPRQ